MGHSLSARGAPLASTDEQLRVLAQRPPGILPFEEKLRAAGLAPLRATGITVFQINVGKLCNQTCNHCHVDAGPDRREIMTEDIARACIRALEQTTIPTVDITGGAPELTPHFRYLVERSKDLGRHVIDRCNLTVLLLAKQSDLVDFLASHQVEVIASLPYYQAAQTDAQRGTGVFDKSIEAIRKLNQVGYGVEGSELRLNLVFNPVGAFLPPRQEAIESVFRRQLSRNHDVVFNELYTITNLPISRFLDFLIESGNYEGYMERLANAFNPVAADGVMCRYTLSVGWDGALYDCDFNQMLNLQTTNGAPRHILQFNSADLDHRQIVTNNHCYGCTAGAGSSCGGGIA